MSARSLHPSVEAHCPHCHGLGAVVVRDGEVARAERCSCVTVCRLCKDTGWVSAGDDRMAPRRRCTCGRLRLAIERFDRARIPARHALSTRGSFKPTSPKQHAVMIGVSTWIEDYQPHQENRGMVLHGKVGRGKTHLMVAMLRELVFRHGITVRFVEFSHLLADLKSGFDQKLGMARLIDPLVAVDVLAIDELGKGRNTEFEGTVLDELISRRYNSAATILATTNYSPDIKPTGRAVANSAAVAMGTKSAPSLSDRVGARVHSRLQEMCDFLPVDGLDHRELQRDRRRST